MIERGSSGFGLGRGRLKKYGPPLYTRFPPTSSTAPNSTTPTIATIGSTAISTLSCYPLYTQ